MNRFEGVLIVEGVSTSDYIAFGAYSTRTERRLNVDGFVNGGFTTAYIGQTVTGVTSLATGVIVNVVLSAGFSFLELEDVSGLFQNNENLTAVDPATGVSLVRGDANGADAAVDIDNSYGPRIHVYSGNPNGVLSATAGSLSLDAAGGVAVYRCTGGSVWAAV